MNEYPINHIPKNNNDLIETSRETQNIKVAADEVDNYIQTIFDKQIIKRENFFQRFFPDALQRTIKQGEEKLLQTKYDYLVETSTIIKNTQVESLRERANHYLNQRKAQLRAETASFLVTKAQELEKEIDKIFDDFTARIEERYEKNQLIKQPFLKRKMEQQLEKDIEGFLEIKEEVIGKFRRIVKEGV